MAAIDPAVKPFKDRGGKIIIYQGWMDPSVLAQPVVAYYEEVQKVMGGALYKHFYPGGQGERVEKRDSRKANGGMALGRHALPGWERAFLEEQARQGAGFAEILHLLIEFRLGDHAHFRPIGRISSVFSQCLPLTDGSQLLIKGNMSTSMSSFDLGQILYRNHISGYAFRQTKRVIRKATAGILCNRLPNLDAQWKV